MCKCHKKKNMTKKLQNQWIVTELEELHSHIAGAFAFDDKTDPLEAYLAFMSFIDKLINKIYKKEGMKRPFYTITSRLYRATNKRFYD